MGYAGSYVLESAIEPGMGVVQGSTENTVRVAVSGDFIGVYPYEAGKLKKKEKDHIGILMNGEPAKVLVSGEVHAGKYAVLSTVAADAGTFVECPNTAGVYAVCGVFLQSGKSGDYVEMLPGRCTHIVE